MQDNCKHITNSKMRINLPSEQSWFGELIIFAPDYDKSNNDSNCDNTM